MRDSGIGIARDQQQAIFGEFYQVGNPERDRRKGLGLGLAIVNALTRQLGYTVNVRSAPGRGSTFTFRVPAASGVAIVENDVPNSGDRLRGLCIAIIDDDQEVREALATLIARWGCLPVAGVNADEIIKALAAPDCLAGEPAVQENRSGPADVRRLIGISTAPFPR